MAGSARGRRLSLYGHADERGHALCEHHVDRASAQHTWDLCNPDGFPDHAMTELLLKEYTATSCIGRGRAATLDALRSRRGGLASCTFETASIDTWTGEVRGVD